MDTLTNQQSIYNTEIQQTQEIYANIEAEIAKGKSNTGMKYPQLNMQALHNIQLYNQLNKSIEELEKGKPNNFHQCLLNAWGLIPADILNCGIPYFKYINIVGILGQPALYVSAYSRIMRFKTKPIFFMTDWQSQLQNPALW